MMSTAATSYAALRSNFSWQIPAHFNIGVDVCDKWAERDPDRQALVFVDDAGGTQSLTFGALRDASNRLANVLVADGIARGDRVGVLLPQSLETAISHIAILKLGAVAVPLFTLFGVEALHYRLANCAMRAVITDDTGSTKLAGLRDTLPALEHVYSTGSVHRDHDLGQRMAAQSPTFEPLRTLADDPAFIIYTSGTTGQPKGALHAHRVLLGHLPGVEMSHDQFPKPGDRIWTPADWAWIGGLLDVLMPALHHGVPVVACRFRKFTGEAAFQLIADQRIRNAFLPPTALKMMRQVDNPAQRWSLNMRTVASGGETLGAELLDWGRATFGLTINEFYGQTECNMIVSSCGALSPARPGRMGRAVPGHDVEVIDAEGNILPDQVQGAIAVRAPDPVMFLQYWDNPAATAAKFVGDWLITGDTGMREADGWLRFIGRDDDVITSSGYRIGPGEIEDCLLRHPCVAMAGVVGKPDPQRTEIVKAYIVLKEGVTGSDGLATEIADFVKQRLAAHEYPREIAFVAALPMTTTGKVIRRQLRDLDS